ncbi:MAG: DNA repair protein RadA [Chloroflexia bacterium]
MPRTRTVYVCQQCGYQSSRWMGRCPECQAWDSLVETPLGEEERRGATPVSLAGAPQPLPITEISTDGYERIPIPLGEFSRVLGGGIVPGSLVLMSGDPGIGKSTMLSQVAALVAEQGDVVLYVSAEESAQQVKLRARRLGRMPPTLYVLSETNLDRILQHIERMNPALVVVDSIQSVYLEALESAAGSVSQVREGAAILMRLAKERNIPIFLVGHVTKSGAIAGPRVLEHIVDTVLYLEGDRFHQYRLLRSVKNRFGSTFEVGVFEMSAEGLREVENPSQAFLAERSPSTPGSTVVVTMEGTRPILVEVQALTATSSLALPRRTANGIELGRLLLLVAVLSKRVGLTLGNQDIYVNVVGGMRIHEPAADLAVATAIASVFRNAPVDPEMVLIGEIGLSGELRSVGQLERRLAEAAKLGFKRSLYPRVSRKPNVPEGFELIGVRSVAEALDVALQR